MKSSAHALSLAVKKENNLSRIIFIYMCSGKTWYGPNRTSRTASDGPVSELVTGLSIVTGSIPAPPQFVTLLVAGMCIYMMPDCRTDSSGKAIMPHLCEESCERIFKHRHLCHQLFVAASRSSLVLAEVLKFDAIHTDFRDFQCVGLPSQDSGSCYDMLLSKYRMPINIIFSKTKSFCSLDFPTLPPPIPRATTNSSAVTPSKAKPQREAKCAFPFTY